jgi:ribosomal protein S12 methylthiotransferase accessory factor
MSGIATSFTDLLSPHGGLIVNTKSACLPWTTPRLRVHFADLGDISHLLPLRDRHPTIRLSGVGRAFNDIDARNVAIIEALERYSACQFDPKTLVTATATELGDSALDHEQIPRCSKTELEDTHCPLRAIDPGKPIRWVKGVALASGKETFIPAVLVYLYMPTTHNEQFWLQISTGCAAHTDLRAALAAGICEIIERDAVALTWLQRLRLPLIPEHWLQPQALELVHSCAKRGIQTLLFDATTDLGVPTAYCLQLAPHDERAAQIVGCASSPVGHEATLKALTEVCVSRLAVHKTAAPPSNPLDFHEVLHGASYLGHPERKEAFSFLWKDACARQESKTTDLGGGPEAFQSLLDSLAVHGMNSYAVNITTREAAAVGVSVVRVIIPELQPITFRPVAQYRGHSRLYRGPAAMGHPVNPESDLNPWPQPFP